MTDRSMIRARMAQILGIDESRITDDAALVDLVNSSFLLVEMVIELQEDFDIRLQQSDMNDVTRAGQLLDLVEGRMSRASDG